MKKLTELSDKELFEIYDLIFDTVHSPGFKKAEVKTALTDPEYWFLERPIEGYKENVLNYLNTNGFEKPETKIWN